MMQPATLIFMFFVAVHSPHELPEYYKEIYGAEQLLCEARFNESCLLYKKAFRTGKPFFADLRNAFRTAVLSGEEDHVMYFWNINAAYPDIANEIRLKADGLQWLSPESLRQITTYSRKRNKTPAELVVDSIRIADQDARHACPRNNDETCRSVFRKTDSRNVRFLADMLKKLDYSESEYGEELLHTCFLVALHARRWGYVDLDSALGKLLRDGRIKPLYVAQLLHYRSDIDSINGSALTGQPNIGFGATSLIVNNHLIEMNQYDSTIDIINQNRKVFFMDDVRNDIMKQALTFKHDLFRNQLADLTLEVFSTRMSDMEYADFIRDLTKQQAIKKIWY